jgi:hypothetical protein
MCVAEPWHPKFALLSKRARIFTPTPSTGSHLYTDALKSYLGLSDAYTHEMINHAIEFVRGRVHTNNIENFWILLKRTPQRHLRER